MIDTLYLQTSNFELRNLENFDVKQGSRNILLGFREDEETQEVSGISARYVDRPKVSHRAETHFEVSTRNGKRLLTIKIPSLPRILYLNNLSPFDAKEEYQDALINLKSIAKRIGLVITNWDTLQISRIDLAYTLIVKFPVETYLNLLKAIKLPSLDKVIYDHGVAFKSKNRTFAFYDKFEQMRDILEDYGVHGLPYKYTANLKEHITTKLEDHIMRIEFQFRGGKNIKNLLNVSTWKDIAKDNQNLREYFHAKSTEIIDKIPVPKTHTATMKSAESQFNLAHQLNSRDISKIFTRFQRKHGRNWYSYAMKTFGEFFLKNILQTGLMEAVKRTVKQQSKGKAKSATYYQQVSRINGSIEDSSNVLGDFRKTHYLRSDVTALKNELKLKLYYYNWLILGPPDVESPMYFNMKREVYMNLKDSKMFELGELIQIPYFQTRKEVTSPIPLRQVKGNDIGPIRTQILEKFEGIIRQKIPYAEIENLKNLRKKRRPKGTYEYGNTREPEAFENNFKDFKLEYNTPRKRIKKRKPPKREA